MAREHERNAGVRHDLQLAYGGAVVKFRILSRVRNDERRVARDGVLAERIRERRFAARMPRLGQADGALEKLPVAVDERDERDRRFQEARRETRQAVEWLFSRRVEEPRPAERCEPVQIADDIDEIRHASTLPRTRVGDGL